MSNINKIMEAYLSMKQSVSEQVEEVAEAKECPKCEGKGCDHCDDKGVHEKKLDPVDDKENDKKFKDRKDKDIDNDGDHDKSDKYLLNRRKTVAKAMGKKTHICASYVEHAEFGICKTIPEAHTLEEMAEPDAEGNTHFVTHYDIIDDNDILHENVSVEELEIVLAESHNH